MMPKPHKKRTPFSELSREEKLKKVRRLRRKTREVLEGPERSNVRPERARAFKAGKAAERVERRITGKAPSRLDAYKPGSKLAEGVRGLIALGKSIVSAPGKLKGGLEEVARRVEER